MQTEARVIRFDQGGASQAYMPNIFALTESGSGGKLSIDVLASTEQTTGASELADAVQQSGVASFPRFDTSPDAPFVTSPVRTRWAFKAEVPIPFYRIESQVRAALEADPVEDGYSHPAEVLLEKFIRDSGDRASEWLIGLLSSEHWSAGLRAGLLRLLSRQKPLTEKWRLRIIKLCLSSPNIELRDAAVQAAESWEDAGVIHLLQAHWEPCLWLADYAARVIRDLMR